MSVEAYLGLGANLGQARSAVLQAVQALGACDGVRVLRCSSLYRSVPLDADGPSFINAVLQLETQLDAHTLLKCLHALENRAGRVRSYRNAPRTLDLDLLLYGDARIQTPQLTVPHPRMHARAFVLVPLAEIAPHLVPAEQLAAVAGQGIEKLPD